MRNAFGTVDRQKMLAEVKRHCPCLFPYAATCYRNANLLLGEGYFMESTRGVQQGDVVGSALFAIALQPVVEDYATSALPYTCGIWTTGFSLVSSMRSRLRYRS